MNTTRNIPNASFPLVDMNRMAQIMDHNFKTALLCDRAPQSLIILGGPGSGKTAYCTDVSDPEEKALPFKYANYLSEKTGTLVTVEDIKIMVIRVAEKDGQEFAGPGCPYEDAQGRMYFKFSVAPTLIEMAEFRRTVEGAQVGYKYFLVILDELASASADLQKVVANMLHSDDRTLGGHALPDGAYVVATGNMPQDGAGAGRLLAHLVDRPLAVELKVDGNVWIERYAEPRGICPIMVEFVRQHWVDTVCQTPPLDYGNYTTFRSLTEASYGLSTLVAERDFDGRVPAWFEDMLSANVGCKTARLLADFVEQAGEVARPHDIFMNPQTATVSDNVGYQYISASMVLGAAKNMEQATAALTYVMRLRTDLIVSIGKKLFDLLATPEFTDEIMTSRIWQDFERQYGEYLRD